MMQLTGPTAAEVPPRLRITAVNAPPPRPQDTQHAPSELLRGFNDLVRREVQGLEPYRRLLGLTGQLTIRVHIDSQTGRVSIQSPGGAAPVRTEGPEGSGARQENLDAFSRELLIRLRKDAVLPLGEGYLSRIVDVPTIVGPIGTRPRPQDPYAPQGGVGLLEAIREAQLETESQERLAQNPGLYDPGFIPPITVRMESEEYRYDFTRPGVSLDEVCKDISLGCVTMAVPHNRTHSVSVTRARQSLNNNSFNSPVGVSVESFSVLFTMYMPREDPGSTGTLNHELNHLVESYTLVQAFKDRLARAVRARLVEVRRQAAEHPNIRDVLLSDESIREIVRQEHEPLEQAFVAEWQRRNRPIDERDITTRPQIPGTWRNFQMPRLQPDATGSFVIEPPPGGPGSATP
jgi:hypothetical protein